MDKVFEKIINALSKNGMNGIYAENCEQVRKIVEEMLFDGCSITMGGSQSVKESGVLDIIKSSKYNFLDRNRNGITKDEQLEVYKATVGSDFYFCSSNAITENGELINVDGNSNRVSAIAYGPKRVVMIVGKNKIVKDTAEGFLRVKKVAAPKNCVRLGIDNPCAKLGHCVSLEKSDCPDISGGCAKQSRICRNYLLSAAQQHIGRITVILVNENLGF